MEPPNLALALTLTLIQILTLTLTLILTPTLTRYYFGEAALMGDTTTTASISCVTYSVLLVLNRKTLLKLTG